MATSTCGWRAAGAEPVLPVPGGVPGLLVILFGLGAPALFLLMLGRLINGLRSGEIWFRARLDRKLDSPFDYWSSMLVLCLATLTTGAIALLFFSLSLVLIGQMRGR